MFNQKMRTLHFFRLLWFFGRSWWSIPLTEIKILSKHFCTRLVPFICPFVHVIRLIGWARNFLGPAFWKLRIRHSESIILELLKCFAKLIRSQVSGFRTFSHVWNRTKIIFLHKPKAHCVNVININLNLSELNWSTWNGLKANWFCLFRKTATIFCQEV